MTKIIYFFTGLCLLVSCQTNPNNRMLTAVSNLPMFSMLLPDSATLINSKQIPSESPVIIIYFNPDCPYCNRETRNLLQNMQELKECQIIFLSNASFGKISTFSLHYQLDRYPNITIGKDYNYSFTRIFRPTTIPYIALYNREKQLIKIYNQEVPVVNIINSICNRI